MKLLLSLLIASNAWAGQSLVLTTGSSTAGTSVDPSGWAGSTSASAWRVDFQIHNWTLPGTCTQFFRFDGLGMSVLMCPNGTLLLRDNRDPGSGDATVSIAGMTNALVRMQRNPSGSAIATIAANSVYGEAWNYDASLYNSGTATLTVGGPCAIGSGTYPGCSWFSGGQFGGVIVDIGFINVFSTLIAPGSTPPVTAARGDYTALTFDNILTDSSGNAHNVTYSGATFVTTPNQVAVSISKTIGAPSWSNWLSLRAGHAAQLDGTTSYSLADASSTVTYKWYQTSGSAPSPSNVLWDGTLGNTSGTPKFSGALSGPYYFNLQVTDVNGNVATTALNGSNGVGVVATDANHVVVPANPLVTKIFGPQIAFGYNPWTYQDQQNLFALNAQIPFQASGNDWSWLTLGSGTVSWPFDGIGLTAPLSGSTLTTTIINSSTQLVIADCSKLPSLATLPTSLSLGNPTSTLSTGGFELTRIASIASGTATSAPCTVNVAYDGRGVTGAIPGGGGQANPGIAQGWPNGTVVGEFRLQGTSTHFFSDANKPLAPAGAALGGGPVTIGPVVAGTTGTVTLSASSTTLTCATSCGWSSSYVNYMVTIPATHNSGTAFNFMAQITGFTDSTHLVMNRPAPTGVDGTAFTPTFTNPGATYLSLTVPSLNDGHTIRLLYNLSYCESETVCFPFVSHDIPGLDGTMVTGNYSFKTFLGEYNGGGINMPNSYGSGGLMPLSLWQRSGYAPAQTLATTVNGNFIRDPEIAESIGCGENFPCGGGIIGAIADFFTNPNTVLTYQNLETAAFAGSVQTNTTDLRDAAYGQSWETHMANLDPNNGASTLAGSMTNGQTTISITSLTSFPVSYPFVIQVSGTEQMKLTSATTVIRGWNGTTAVSHSSGDAVVSGRGIFTNLLSAIEVGDQTYQRTAANGYSGPEVGSFASNASFAPTQASSTPQALTLTNGSTAVTGTGFTNTGTEGGPYCYGVDIVSLSLTNGSSTATVTSGTLTQQNLLYIYDNVSFYGVYAYTVSGSTVTLGTAWQGATGTTAYAMSAAGDGGGNMDFPPNAGYMAITYSTTNTGAPDVLAQNELLRQMWECKYNSSTSLTLFAPWSNTSSSGLTGGNSYYMTRYNIVGFISESFFTGIKSNQMIWAQQNSNPTTVSGYAAISANLGNQVEQYDYSPVSHGVRYTSATLFNACGPLTDVPTPGTSMLTMHGATCDTDGLAPGAWGLARTDNVETFGSMYNYWVANPTQTATVDRFYGAVFGAAGTCAASVSSTCDGMVAGSVDNTDLSGFRWPGFFFGMGFYTSSWPAYRLGGIQAAQPRTLAWQHTAPAGTVSAAFTVTQPNTVATTTVCSESAGNNVCYLAGYDATQGDGQVTVVYTLSSGLTIATAKGDYTLVKNVY